MREVSIDTSLEVDMDSIPAYAFLPTPTSKSSGTTIPTSIS